MGDKKHITLSTSHLPYYTFYGPEPTKADWFPYWQKGKPCGKRIITHSFIQFSPLTY